MSVALLFSPQGSQAVGMGRELAVRYPVAAAVWQAADAAAGWAVSDVAWHGPEDVLNDTQQTQPALVACSLAALAALREASVAAGLSLEPAFVAGHSVGEYAALVAAGVLAPTDAIRLVALRGRLMSAAGAEGGMTAVIGMDREAVAEVIGAVASPADLVVANDNAPGQVVISGTRDALLDADAPLKAAGARRLIGLPVSGPFHSPWMAEVGDALAAAFGDVAWHDAEPPLVSNVTAEPVTDAGRIRALLAEQVRSPVEWVASVRRMAEEGVDTFIECGPGSALTGMVRRIAPEARTANVSDVASLDATLQALAGVPAEASA
ncbi:MAG TPA: ACP S-malonyltransferase [Candidatus Limnocylindria bacterium]|nr:ACP S-malonyltransferase [Candidatus Limnocylindria bacterium]